VIRASQPDMRNAALIDLIEAIEARGEHSFVASILVLEGKKLQHAAGPNLPARYRDAINGLEIGPATGSCGTAAFCGHQIYVSDISTDPLWANWSDITNMALEAGLKACWSTPIMSGGKVLGTFAIYHREPRSPTVVERDLIAEAARSAAALLGPSSSGNRSNTDAIIHN
jgi:GAF domain-containing protein